MNTFLDPHLRNKCWKPFRGRLLFLLLLLPLLFLLLFLMMILIIYWVCLSSEHLFQVYTKYDGLLLQSVRAFFIAKCSVIIKWDSYYKVRQFHHKVRQALQRATIITMWGRTNTRIFLYVQKKPSSETIQFTTAILFCFTSLTFSRISFGIRTFATLNLSFKRTNSVSSRPWTAIPQE